MFAVKMDDLLPIIAYWCDGGSVVKLLHSCKHIHSILAHPAILVKSKARRLLLRYGIAVLYHCSLYTLANATLVKELILLGADIHLKDDYALRWASRNGHRETVKILLAAGADVHACDDYALQWASLNGYTEIVKSLLEAGANVHLFNDYALRWASTNGHAEIVEILLASGADVHADDDYALRTAFLYGHRETVKMLKKTLLSCSCNRCTRT